jgi:hypothetical protein
LDAAASGMSHASDPLTGPLREFTAASQDLSAFGALGSLLKATGEIRDGMTQLSKIVGSLGAEYDAESTGLGDVAKVFDEVDVALSRAASTRQG